MEPTKTKKVKAPSTLTINGRTYDAVSGQRLDSVTHAPAPKVRQYGSFDVRPSTGIHAGPDRSRTLRRTGLEKPSAPKPLASRHVRTISPVATHPSVSRFGTNVRPQTTETNAPHVVKPSDILSSINDDDSFDRGIQLAVQVQNYSPTAKVSAPIKQATKSMSRKMTDHAVAHAKTHKQKHAARTGIFKTNEADRAYGKVTRTWKKFQKRIRPTPPLIAFGIITVVLIASVICYLTIPALSLFVAAKSAGVEATYPGYVPAGYHFKGPVTYGEGKVSMRFAAAGSSSTFTIEQNDTYWDSGAVLDNYVLARSADYLTYSQSGITVYTFGSQAAWVNAGVLHTIDGTAQLTSDQILRIAGSM